MEIHVKIMIVDDYTVIREGLKMLFGTDSEFEVIAEAASGMECLEKLFLYHPDVVLMDLRMAGISGIEATRLLKSRHPEIKVILMTDYEDKSHAVEAIKAGVDSCILKKIEKEELFRIIHLVLQGQAFIDPCVTKAVFHHLKINAPAFETENEPDRPILSQRELQILAHLVEGKSNKEIANSVFLSMDTVKTHLKNIYQKLDANNRSQASKIAIQEGLISLPS